MTLVFSGPVEVEENDFVMRFERLIVNTESLLRGRIDGKDLEGAFHADRLHLSRINPEHYHANDVVFRYPAFDPTLSSDAPMEMDIWGRILKGGRGFVLAGRVSYRNEEDSADAQEWGFHGLLHPFEG